MLHDKVFCHYYFGKYLLYSANHAFMNINSYIVSFKKNPVKQAKHGDIIKELFLINT